MKLKEVIHQRADMSEYLLHWTTKRGFESIVKTGFLRATDALRPDAPGSASLKPTIRGIYPAVCFSDMPIGNYFQSLCVEKSNYSQKRWILALPKQILYSYGGRPVLYGDNSFCERLSSEDKYLFSRFNLEKSVDWTHEREWRVRPNVEVNKKIVSGNSEYLTGYVPFHLDEHGNPITDMAPTAPQFILIVEQEKDVIEFKNTKPWDFMKERKSSAYEINYFLALTNVKIFSLDYIRNERVQDVSHLLSASGEP